MPEKNPLLSLPKVELTKVDKIANNVTQNASKRSESLKFEAAANNRVINASMYDKKIEKLQSYGSKWNNYGYNPNADNEAFYDKMTSDTEQWGRSIVGAGKLAAIGFNDSVLFGAFSNSKKNADNFGKVADIYSTQRGGITGFTQNLTLNAGYTMGIMADMAVEELAIAGITALTAIPSGGTSVIAGGAGMIAKGVKAFGQIGKAFDKMNDLKKAINAADKINDVSKMAKVGNKIGNFVNPIEHTTKYIKALKNVSSVKDLSTLGKVAEGGAALFRDVKAIQMAYSEAKLEANMLEKDMYDAYIKENPYMNEEQLKDLDARVANAKQYTTWENAGAIFATNKLVFNNMYKRFDDIKGVGKFFSTGSFGKLASVGEGTAVIRSGNMLQKGFYQGIKDQGKLLFEKGIVNGLGKVGKSAVSATGKYGISNLGEGLQETIQETIQAKNKYQFGSKASGGYYDSVIHGLKEQKSAQGFETFLSGFLMGGLVSPVTSIATAPIKFVKSGAYKQFTDKTTFNSEREKKLDELKKDSDLINEGFKHVGNVYNSMGNSLASQARLEKEMIEAVAEGDRHLFQDKKDESFRTHLHTMMKHGMLDEFVKHTKGFKNMDSKQAAIAFGIDENTKPEVVSKLIDKKVEQAERFKNRYTEFKANYQSPVNLSKLDMNDPAAIEILNYHHNWNKAVDDMIFDTAEFEQNLDRKKDLINKIQTDAQASGISFHDYNALTSDREMNKEIGLLTNEIAVLNGYENLTPEVKKDLTKKSHKLKALIRYQEALGEHSRVIDKIDELQSKPNTTKAEKALLKKLNKQVKRAADTMELRHGQYLEVVHSGEYDPNNVTVNEASRNSRVNRFSKNSFALLYDYYKLDHRNKALEQSLDVISDTEYIKNYVDRMTKMSDQIVEQHKEYVKNSIAKFRDQEDVNKVVKELLDAGVSFDLSELDELVQKGIMPKQLYNIATEEVLKQSDPKYKMALKKLNDLVDNLIEQPILEKENDIYREVGRGVRINEGDKRTYNEIAKEYGFDVANEQKVSDVLDTIIASKNSTKAEKDLAKILKKLVDENAKVSFVDNSSRPNKFKDGVSIIDGRYAASNFTNSVFSIEELILKNELERLTTDALKNDPVFNAEVKSLKEAAIAYVNSENEKNKDDQSKQLRDNWKAFDSELDFIKESFANQSFQALLAQIKAPKKESTIWTDLIDALSNLLGRTADVSNSVYNSIVSVVQAKIDPSQLNAPQQDDSLVEEVDTPEITPETTPEEIDVVQPLPAEDLETFDPNAEISSYPKALLNQLIDGYKQAIKDGDAAADAKINELSITNLTPKFKTWVDDYGTEIINAYDVLVNEPMQANSEVLDEENKAVLAGKGYTAEEVDTMTPGQVTTALTEEEVVTSPNESLIEQVIDELIDENIIIESDEETSEETIPVDTTGEGTSDTVSDATTEEETTKSPREIELAKIKYVAADMDYYETPLSSTRFNSRKDAEAYVNAYFDKLEQAEQVSTVTPVEKTEATQELLRTDEDAIKKLFFANPFETGLDSPKDFFTKLAKIELEKEALANKKLFKKVVAPTKEEINNRAFEMYFDKVKNVKQDSSLFLWNVYDGKGGFDSKYKSEGKSISLNTVDVRDKKELHTYTFNETFNNDGIRFVDIKIPIQETDSSGSNRPPIFTSILITLPDGMSAAQVAEPLLAKAKEISANRTSYKNPTTTKEMVDALIPIAEGIIKNTKTESQTATKIKEAPTTSDEINNIKILLSLTEKANGEPQRYISRKIMELANANDKSGGQNVDTIIRRGGYAQYELDEYLPGWRNMLELPGEKTTSEKPVGRNQSMHEKLVSELESNKAVTGTLMAKGPGNKSFVLEVNGEKVIFYDYNNEVSTADLNKKVTLKLVPELIVEGKPVPFTNVIQVYSGDRFLGNVAVTDYNTTAKDTLPKDASEEELRSAAENIVDNNEQVFATTDAKMKELGYTPTDIKRLSKEVKMHIVKNEITKAQYTAEQKALKKLDVQNQVQSGITDFLKNRFTGIKTEAGLVDVYEELVKHATAKLGVTLNEINDVHLPFIQNIFNQAKIDLANQKDFSTLSIGDKLLLTDGRIVKVAKVNKTSVDVVDFNSIIENKVVLTSKQFNTDVKKVINDFNLKQDEIVSALDQNNLDDLSSILSKFTTQSFAIADEEVTDEDILEHFKACK